MGKVRTEKCIAIESIELASSITEYLKEGTYSDVMCVLFEKLKELNHEYGKSEGL